MRAVGIWAVVGGVLGLAAARAGDRPARVLVPNAVQPPGASFEESNTGRQKFVLLRDVARDSAAAILTQPVRSSVLTTYRIAERLGVGATGSFPGLVPPTPPRGVEAGGPCTPARLTPIYESGPAFAALLDLIAQTQRRIDLMMFGWDDDAAGRRVADALIARARSGVVVRLLVDRGGFVIGAGNARLGLGLPTFLDSLRAEPNVQLIEAPDPFFRFDHRKVAVFDGRIVWTGGMILTQASVERWHNFAFLAEGPIVTQYSGLFAERWAELGGPPASGDSSEVGSAAVAPNTVVRMVRTEPTEQSLREAVYGAVDSARSRIFIENPYFSDKILIHKLRAASRRGVDVRAILTMRGDTKLMNRASNETANALLRGGARVFLYPAMTHVKALSVDGEFAYIGSGNFDELSLRTNREVALTVRGAAWIADLDAHLFARDMAQSEELHDLLPPPHGRLAVKLLRLWL